MKQVYDNLKQRIQNLFQTYRPFIRYDKKKKVWYLKLEKDHYHHLYRLGYLSKGRPVYAHHWKDVEFAGFRLTPEFTGFKHEIRIYANGTEIGG